MTTSDAGRLEVLELRIAELEDDLLGQNIEIEMLREMVIQLMSQLHVDGVVKLQTLADMTLASAQYREDGPDAPPASLAPSLAKELRAWAARLDDADTP